MSMGSELYNYAELAQAAYADLIVGPTNSSSNLAMLKDADDGAGMTSTQAEQFAARYTKVIAVVDDSINTGFAATIFESSDGQLKLAIRGTDDLFGSDGDDDLEIFSNGIASEQIIAMVNWWNRVTAEVDSSVEQFTIVSYVNGTSSVPGAVSLYSVPNGNNTVTNYYLEPTANVLATGELYGRMDQELSITGHSLGGHLAMAFGSLFPDATQGVTVFNAPGFLVNTFSQSLFQALGGVVPNGQLTTNVIADESSTGSPPWNAVAGLHSRPGNEVYISIENQLSSKEPDRPAALNHSQMVLTDSLAVYNLLYQMDENLSESDFDTIFQLASNEEYKSLERIVDSLEALLDINSTALAVGNNHREALYKAVYGIQGSAAFQDLKGATTIASVNGGPETISDLAAANTESGRGYRYTLVNLLPFAIISNLAGTAADDPKYDVDNYTPEYLSDRAQMLELILKRNAADITTPESLDETLENTLYIDQKTNLKLTTGNISVVGVTETTDRIYFGDESQNVSVLGIESHKGDDRLYGMGGEDEFSGGEGDDYLEGGADNDTLKGDAGSDTLVGGAGEDKLTGGKDNDFLHGGADDNARDIYYFKLGDGHDHIGDADSGGDRIEIEGLSDLADLEFKSIGESEDTKIYIANGDNEDITDDVIFIKGTFSIIQYGQGEDAISITLNDYADDSFGISLGDKESEEQEPGDQQQITGFDGAGTYVHPIPEIIGYDPDGNPQYQNRDQYPNGFSYQADEYYDPTYVADVYEYWEAWAADPSVITPGVIHAVNFGGFYFWGSPYEDFLYGGEIPDKLVGMSGDDVIQGAGGVDVIAGGSGSDKVSGGEGNDVVIGYVSTQYLNEVYTDYALPESGLNYSDESGTTDYIEGNAGSDFLIGSRSRDIISGGTEGDSIGGGLNNDILNGDEGNDVIFGDSVLHYSPDYDQDILYANVYGNQDNYNELSTDDVIDGGKGQDILLGEFGNDLIAGGADDDIILGDRNDQLELVGSNYLSAFAFLYPYGFDEVIEFDISTLPTEAEKHGDDIINGGAGEDYIEGNGGDDIIYGELGNDIIHGDDFALEGEFHGNDTLYGGKGSDLIVGHGGKDSLYGNQGDDTIDGDNGELDGQYHGDDLIYGGEGIDAITGNGDNDTIYGGDGNDQITGDAEGLEEQHQGNDIVYGEKGNDVIFGMGGDDSLDGGAGDDILMGDNGSDQLKGGSGADTLYGGDGDDLLDGGADADGLYGEGGADTYKFNRGDGIGVIDDTSGSNKIEFGSGISLQDLFVAQYQSNSYIYFSADHEDRIQLTSVSFRNIGGVHFADGSSVNLEELIDAASGGEDYIYGGNESDSLRGGGGNDELHGFQGDDTLYGGTGDDELWAGSNSSVHVNNGNNELYGGEGNDSLYGGDGSDTLTGGEGNDAFYGKDHATGVFEGGPGNDTYHLPYYDDDISLIELPDEGEDKVFAAYDYILPENIENLEGTQNASYLVGNNLDNKITAEHTLGSILDGGEGVDILTGSWGKDTFIVDDPLDQVISNDVSFRDSVYSSSDYSIPENIKELWLLGSASYGEGNDGDNTMGAYTETASFWGHTNSSVAVTLAGRKGNDTLYGTYYGDTFIYDPGDGQDTIIEDSLGAEVDTLVFGAGIDPTDIALAQDDLNLVLTNNTNSDQVTIVNWFQENSTRYRVENIEFGDGSIWRHNVEIPALLSGGANKPPVAVDDVDNGPEDISFEIDATDLLSNDTDIDGDTLSITAVSTAQNGTVDLEGETIIFTPNEDYHGPASFQYTLSDGTDTDTGTVSLTIDSVNDAPVVVDDNTTTTEDTALVINVADLLANDTDLEGDTLSITLVGSATNGTAILDTGAGTITFTPNAGYTGPASFTYTVSDGTDTNQATVAVDVTPTVNTAPLANNDTATGSEDASLVINVADLLMNDTDIDGDTLNITAVGTTTNGTAVLDTGAGTITFAPDADYHGPASFEYTVSDGTATDSGTVNLTINSVNDGPVAQDDTGVATQDAPLLIDVATLLGNDTDTESDTLSITAVANPLNGLVSLDGDSITFTPDAGHSGPASFEYTLSDGTDTDTGSVNITVNNVNDSPVAVDDVDSGLEDASIVINVADLLINDTDADGDTLSITAVSSSVNGGAVLDTGAGTITFTPDADYHGPASFAYTVSDGTDSGTGTVNLTINSVNDAPVAVDDSATTLKDTALVINVADLLGNDTDLEGDTLSITSVGSPSNGTAVLDAGGGIITFIPDTGYTGPASFDYAISDGSDTAYGTVNISVNTAGAILAVMDRIATPEDIPVTINVLANDQYDPATVTVSAVQAGNGSTTINSDNSISYTPNTGYKGTDSFTYEISDGAAVSSNTVHVSVSETWTGTSGNNTNDFSSTSHPVVFTGLSGTDNLTGGSGDDTFLVNANGDNYFDWIYGGAGYDRVLGTSGDDVFGFKELSGVELIDGGEGYDVVQISQWGTHHLDLTLVTLDSIELIKGSAKKDTIIGTPGDDLIESLRQSDYLYGGEGNDVFRVDATADNYYDAVFGGPGYDRIVGTSGDDLFGYLELSEIEKIEGGEGYDIIQVSQWGTRELDLTEVNLDSVELIRGSLKGDTIIGTSGDDYIESLDQSDHIYGGDGDDLLKVSATADNYFDWVYGGDGYDTILGTPGNDLFGIKELSDVEAIQGGDGFDTIQVSRWGTLELDLSGVSLYSVESIKGSPRDDFIIGSQGDDLIEGGGGKDNISGYSGNDSYLYSANDGRDSINNYSENWLADKDVLIFEGLNISSLWFTQNGDDLVIDHIGSADQITIDDWFLGDAYIVDEIHASGQVLYANQVQQLIDAIAGFGVEEPSSLSDLTQQQQDEFNTAIAAVWQ